MRKIIYLLLLISVSTEGICQSDFDVAVKKYYDGDLSTAVGLFTKCIESGENIATSYMYRGAARAFLGGFEEAFKDLRTSYQMDSANDKIYYYMGKAHLLNKEYVLASDYFKKSIQRKKNDPDRYDGLAIAEIYAGNYKNAIAAETMAIELDSVQSIFWQNRGFASLKLGYFEKAIKDLSKALSLEKNDKSYFDRALAYSQMKIYSSAIDDFNAALSIRPGIPEVLYYRGLVLEYMGRTKEGCVDLNQSLQLGFEDALAAIKTYCK